jgi:hypothetical protein
VIDAPVVFHLEVIGELDDTSVLIAHKCFSTHECFGNFFNSGSALMLRTNVHVLKPALSHGCTTR